MKRTILFALLAIGFQISFSQTIAQEGKIKKKSAFYKQLNSRDCRLIQSLPEKGSLYKKAAKQKLDNVIVEEWNGSSYSNSEKHDFTYDANGNVSTGMISFWDLGVWAKYKNTIYTRDTKGNATVVTDLGWSDALNKFVNDTKDDYTFDSKDNIITQINSEWDMLNNKWSNHVKFDNTFNGSNQFITQIISDWDMAGSKWVNFYKTEFTYDTKGNILTQIDSKWNTTSLKFDNYLKTENTYDANYYNTKVTTSLWNASKSVWENLNKRDRTYDSKGNQLTDYLSDWNAVTNKFENNYRITKTYDAKNNKVSEINVYWDEDISEWVNEFKMDNTFDVNIAYDQLFLPYDKVTIKSDYKTKPLQTIEYYWDEFDNLWSKDLKSTYNYSNIGSGSTINLANSSGIEVFPNPAIDKVFIIVQNYSGNVSVKIYDISGKLVQSAEMGNSGYLEIDSLKSGIYLIEIGNEQALLGNRKLIVD